MREINHLSLHQWLRSAIPDSQQPTSPIGFLFLKLPPPPCAILLANTGALLIGTVPFSETSFAGHFPILFDDCPIEFPEADEDDSWEVEFMSRLEEISRKDQRRGEMGMALGKSKKSRDSC